MSKELNAMLTSHLRDILRNAELVSNNTTEDSSANLFELDMLYKQFVRNLATLWTINTNDKKYESLIEHYNGNVAKSFLNDEWVQESLQNMDPPIDISVFKVYYAVPQKKCHMQEIPNNVNPLVEAMNTPINTESVNTDDNLLDTVMGILTAHGFSDKAKTIAVSLIKTCGREAVVYTKDTWPEDYK